MKGFLTMNIDENKDEKNILEQSETEVQQNTFEEEKPPLNDNLYDEILKKLDIKKTEIQNEKITTNKDEIFNNKLKQVVKSDVDKIIKLIEKGVLNPLQGQSLMNHVVEKAYKSMVQDGDETSNSENLMNKTQSFFEFNRENPDFF